MDYPIRKAIQEDLPYLKGVLDSIELFPSEMLDEMISGFFSNPDSEDIWFTATKDSRPIAIAYCAPEKLTEGTFNLLAIGVKSDIQSRGLGSKMMRFIETELKKLGHRILIVDTSGTDSFEGTRKFYEKLGYEKEAVIRDYWSEGDDKVTYRKRLI